MRAKWHVSIVAALAAVVVLGVAIARSANADPPYPDYVLAGTSTRVNYVVPARVAPTVTQDVAIATARRFVSAPSGTVRSVRLGLYSDLADRDVLVWVVDLDGIHYPALAGPVHRNDPQPAPRVFTRAVIFVSATAPDQVIGTLAAAPR
jgi:hypothetical protein